MRLEPLNCLSYTNKFIFPFYFDVFNKKPIRYAFYNYDYIPDLDSKIQRSYFFLDAGLKGVLKIPFNFYYKTYPRRLKTTRLFF